MKNEHVESKTKLNVGLMQNKTVWFTEVFQIMIREHLVRIHALLQAAKNQYKTEIINLIIFISLYGFIKLQKVLISVHHQQQHNQIMKQIQTGSCWNNLH